MNDNPYPTLFPLDCRQKPIHVHFSQMSELTLLLLSEHISPFFISLSRHNPLRQLPLPFSLLSSSRYVIPPAPIPSILLLRSSISLACCVRLSDAASARSRMTPFTPVRPGCMPIDCVQGYCRRVGYENCVSEPSESD
jgi:hypothetical protein